MQKSKRLRNYEQLTDKELLRVIESSLPTEDRYATYPRYFIQKGYSRKDRSHLDPPALVAGPGGRAHYAVVCGFYQQHGAEGAEASLEGEVGEGYGTSVKTLTTAGDQRIATPKTKGNESLGRQRTEREMTERPSRRRILDEADLMETTDGEEEKEKKENALRAGLAEAFRFGKGTNELLNAAMQLASDVIVARTLDPNAPGGYARRFNELKGRWRAVNASTDPDLLKEIRE